MNNRELDKRIAIEVMGWKDTGKKCLLDIEPFMAITTEYQNTNGEYQLVPEYSTDISAAFEVVEKLSNYSWEIGREGDYVNQEGVWQVRCGGMSELVKGESLPKAICLAALKCLEVKP